MCPECDSMEVIETSLEFCDEEYEVSYECKDCGCQWHDYYSYASTAIFIHGKVEEN